MIRQNKAKNAFHDLFTIKWSTTVLKVVKPTIYLFFYDESLNICAIYELQRQSRLSDLDLTL